MKSESLKNGRAARRAISRQEAARDSALVSRFNAGDETAFAEIVTCYRVRLSAVAFGVLKNHFDAEEVAQDTFIRAYPCLAAFRGDCSLISWLHCIALNCARNRYWYFYRRSRHATFSLDSPFNKDRPGSCFDLVDSEETNPARQAVMGEFSEVVAAGMRLLDEPHQEILHLRVSIGHSYNEIARNLGIKVGTVKSRVARARQILRELLAQASPEFGRRARPAAWFETIRPADKIALGGG